MGVPPGLTDPVDIIVHLIMSTILGLLMLIIFSADVGPPVDNHFFGPPAY
jgi:hypothetical protein